MPQVSQQIWTLQSSVLRSDGMNMSQIASSRLSVYFVLGRVTEVIAGRKAPPGEDSKRPIIVLRPITAVVEGEKVSL